MSKKQSAAANDEQQTLADLMTAFDNAGISLDESQYRPFSDAEKGASTEWLRKRRIGEKTMLPQCLRPFATRELTEESDAMLSKKREGRKVMMGCIFRKPGFDKVEDGSGMVKVGFKVPDASITGTTAQELFGRTRVNLEFSRRPVKEFDDDGSFVDGTRPVFSVETEIHAFGWNSGNWSFSALVPDDTYPLEDAIADWKSQGTVRVEVLDKLDPEVEEPEQPKRGRGRPKKVTEESESAPNLFDGKKTDKPKEPASVHLNISVAFTDKYRLNLEVKQLDDKQWSSQGSGECPSGTYDESNPSIRSSQNEAAQSSLGRAIKVFDKDESDAEAMQIAKECRRWLKSLTSGQSLEDIAAVEE